MRVTYLKIDKHNSYPFDSSCSSSVSPSDAKKRVVGYTVARSISAVYRLSSNTPLFVRDLQLGLGQLFLALAWARRLGSPTEALPLMGHQKSLLPVWEP